MPEGFSRWDAAEFFKSDEDARLFLEQFAEDATPSELRSALGDFARYLGVQELAKRTGISAKRIFAELNSLSEDEKALTTLLKRLGITPALSGEDTKAAE
jgi:probable addiction module antidote protein